ncbi:hypothetical protein FRC00_000127, partial [Tulasnella sp. 408]
RRAKKWFTPLTANIDKGESDPSQAWRQRRVAGEELLRIADQEAHGDIAVARRFTKSLTRLVIGLRAILRLCEEEEKQGTDDYLGSFSLTRLSNLYYSASRPSYCLMVLVMLHTDRLPFLETVIPGALKEGSEHGLRGIYFLATSIPDFFDHVDPVVIFEQAIQAIRNPPTPRHRWTQAIELIYHSFCHGSTSTEQSKAATLSARRLIVNSTVELCGEDDWELSLIFRVILRMGWVAKDKGIFPSTFPPAVLSNIIRRILSTTDLKSFNVPLALVLKVLALCTDGLQISTIMSPEQAAGLAEVCMQVMCGKFLPFVTPGDPLIVDDRFTRHSDEDAFGILCNLPHETFQDALTATLFPPESGPLYSHQSVGELLDLLLWLSNMPANVVQAHRVLIDGYACRFLLSILTNINPLEWLWPNRADWRAKGEAMTCFGNIIERMNETELRDHVPKAVIEAAVAMKENEEAPLTQRGQAIFMLQRYTVAADRCGVEPYYREEALPLESDQESNERVQIGQLQPEELNDGSAISHDYLDSLV